MRAGFKLLTVLAVASLTAVGCGDDKNPSTDTVGGDVANDTNSDVGTGTDAGDTTTNICGVRECGLFAGENCGTCGAGLSCTSAGKCEVPGQPLGAFCGATATCNSSLAQGSGANQWPGCQDRACESRTCLGNVQGAFILPEVCSRVCQIYKDSNNDGVNDEDAAQDDCNPTDIVTGPTGDKFRCVNFAEPGGALLNLCVPGTNFVTCQSDAGCPSDETCTITNMISGGSNIGQRCVAKFRENASWTGSVSDMSESCNSDPSTGAISYCETGLCFGIGCVPLCANDTDCDTTKVYTGTGCINDKCGGDGRACTADAECSAWNCGEPRELFGNEGTTPDFTTCWPKGCDVSPDCGKGFYCRFFWNGEIGQAAGLENMCLGENPEGVALGEKCDSNTSDNIPGATCKAEDLCIGGYCSAMCLSNSDCDTTKGQACGILEFPIDADDPEDDVYDAVLAFGACQTFPGATGSCLKNADCGANLQCELYAINNPDQSAAADGPYLLEGVCVPVDTATFPGTTGDYGTLCQSSAECKSGYCLGATAQNAGVCSTICEASTDCPAITLDGDTFQGLCNSYLYGWGGNLDDPRVNYNLNLCVPTSDPMTDCSTGYTCAAGEACFPNVISWDPATKSQVEYFCADITTEGDPAPTKTVGQACNPNSEAVECLSGICFSTNGSETVGYCTALCDDNAACSNGTSCIDVTRAARRGQYAGNSATYGLCLQDPICDPCYGHDTCPGDYVCVKSGVANTANDDDGFRCVPGCETTCTGGVTCNAGLDQLGDTLNGCFEKTGNNPAVSCPAVPTPR